jgi:hypothetical protein
MTLASPRICRALLLAIGGCALLGVVLYELSLQPYGLMVEWALLGLWLVSIPTAIRALILERRRGTQDYAWPVLLLLLSSMLLLWLLLTARSVIL